jgi:hypothetical protein
MGAGVYTAGLSRCRPSAPETAGSGRSTRRCGWTDPNDPSRGFRLSFNPFPGWADLNSMLAFTLLVAFVSAYLCAVLVLGVMAVRIDDSHRFVRLVVETRRLRRQFAAPLDAAKRQAESREPFMEV